MNEEEISVKERMDQINKRRDELRAESERRQAQGLTPFPTVEEKS